MKTPTPVLALALLDELERLGFDDRAFARLHHWRAKGAEETIASFRAYCAKHEQFQADGNNARVVQRLELVIKAYRAGFKSISSEVFCALADAAWHEILTPTRSRQSA